MFDLKMFLNIRVVSETKLVHYLITLVLRVGVEEAAKKNERNG